MHPTPHASDTTGLYPFQNRHETLGTGPAGPALQQITAAWKALEALESSMPEGPDRWQAESLSVARDGMRRAWLALSSLDRSLRKRA